MSVIAIEIELNPYFTNERVNMELIKQSLLEINPGDEVVIRDEVGWTPRYRIGVVKNVRKGSIQLIGGDEYSPTSGKARGRYATQQKIYLLTDKIALGGEVITAKEAVDMCVNRDSLINLQTEYTRYILDIGYNKLIKTDVSVLKQVAELLGYKPIGG